MSVTARFAFPLLKTAQAQKEITHNEALTLVDALLHATVESAGETTAPVAAAPGQTWIVGDEATAAWAGRDRALAVWTEGGWRFVDPVDGVQVWVRADDRPAHFRDGVWQIGPVMAGSFQVDGQQVVGPRGAAIPNPAGGETVDAECRAAVSALLQALRGHGLIAEA